MRFMRISELTSGNKPYIRIIRGKKKVDIPITPKFVMLPATKMLYKDYGYVGCEAIRINFKGKTVKLNWTFNHNKMTLFCSSGRKAYSWKNVKVTTVTTANGKKEHLIVCKRAYGDETERRRYKRFPIIKSIVISQGVNRYEASTADISYGGVGIVVKRRINIIPSEPIVVEFGDNSKVKARLVRTVFRDDGSELFGCAISKVYKYELAKIISLDDAIANSKRNEAAQAREKSKNTDAGWNESSIKRWH